MDIPTLVTTAAGFVTVIVSLAGLIIHFERRTSDRFDQVDKRFDQVEKRFDKIDERFEKVDERFDRIEADVVELKVAVARIEGTPPTLLRARG